MHGNLILKELVLACIILRGCSNIIILLGILKNIDKILNMLLCWLTVNYLVEKKYWFKFFFLIKLLSSPLFHEETASKKSLIEIKFIIRSVF